MKDNFVLLDYVGYVYKRVMFIPKEYDWAYLYKYEWEDIDSIVRGMI